MKAVIKKIAMPLACLLLALPFGAFASKGEPWITDMEQAQKIAEAQGKDIFMFYTGSDWCGWCIRLEEEVLDTPEFLQYANKHLVLVELDFPQDEELITPAQTEHNEKWREHFPVSGYPTVFLTDAAVNRYAQTGYRGGGPQPYIEHLQALKTVPAKLEPLLIKADAASGIERIKYLDQILSLEGAIVDQRALEKEIISLLESNELSPQDLKQKYIKNAVVIKGDKELQAELEVVYHDESRSVLEKMAALAELAEKYSYLRDGDAINSLANCASRLGAFSEQPEATAKALEIVDDLIAREGFPVNLQQNFGIAKAALLAKSGNMEAATAEIDRVMKLAPEEPGYRKMLMDHMQKIANGDYK